jgi:hypothetical protein
MMNANKAREIEELSFETKNKTLNFTRFDDGDVLIETADTDSSVKFYLVAEDVEKLKLFMANVGHPLIRQS